MTDKRPQRSNVNTMNLLQNSQHMWNIFFCRRGICILLKLVCRRTQNLPPLLSRRNKIDQLFIRNPMTTGLIMKTLIYVISMEFLLLRNRCPSWHHVPCGEERGEMAVFAVYHSLVISCDHIMTWKVKDQAKTQWQTTLFWQKLLTTYISLTGVGWLKANVI